MMTDRPTRRFAYVKRYKRSIGRQCMTRDCGRPARVTAVDVTGKFRHDVRYCEQHAIEHGAIK